MSVTGIITVANDGEHALTGISIPSRFIFEERPWQRRSRALVLLLSFVFLPFSSPSFSPSSRKESECGYLMVFLDEKGPNFNKNRSGNQKEKRHLYKLLADPVVASAAEPPLLGL